ncbi:MAG: alpha-2-macroglobulin family protein, partial [Verrucomicrobiales bacterium]
LEGLVLRKGGLQRVTREIVLPPETRQLQVEVEPAAEKLKPREKTKLRVRLRDAAGQPFQGQAVVTVYDKSLEYISGGSNVPGMMPYFWDWKRHYYARGGRTSQNQSGGHLVKEGQEIMRNLGLFGGPEFAPRQEGAVLGAAMGGMELTARKSAGAVMPMAAPAMEADSAMSEMALAEPEGGEPEVMVRSEFADLLKWVGELETDERGEAEIELEMPDNLTTWKVRVWALGAGTRVGEGSAEVVTSKDLLVRLQAPRFFVEKDEVTLSAIVHNYHEEAKEVRVSLELDGGLLENESAEAREVAIAPGGESRVDWTVRTRGEGEATVRVKAVAADDADAMEMRFPVFIHGMERTESFSVALGRGQESARIPFEVPEKRRAAESELIVRYAPSVAVAMVEALPYLARYPYGCTEQTLNRFVPTVVVRDLLEDLQVDLAAVKTAREGLNPQNLPGGGAEELRRKREGGWNPVWDAAEVAKMEREGIAKLAEDQNSDGGWGWFSAFGERSYPHTTAVVVHGLLLAKSHGAAVPEEMMQRGVAWLEKHETGELERLRNWENGKAKERKKSADALDALIRRLLGEAGVENAAMRDFLFRDKVNLPVYAKCLLGLELHRVGQVERRDAVLRNIEQFLQLDEENQTAWLELPNRGYWWFWYGGEIEAQAWYLKLLAAVKPESPQAAGLAKYLVNNRKGGTYWKSTRDTAYCLEALGDFLRASGEAAAELEVEILIDGKLVKTEKLTPENLFTSEKTVRVAGDVLTGGAHEIEVRKKGAGPLYVNAWLKVFTLEDHLQKAGLEVKVERRFYKLEPKKGENLVPDARGGLVREKAGGFERVLLQEGDELRSGDLVEVELSIESKNDYEYLLFEDWKAAGLEAVEVRSGYNAKGLGAYMELRDEKVSLFVQNLPRGRHNLSYRLRAEIPGKFSALPTRAEAMYAPELKANSDEMKILVRD